MNRSDGGLLVCPGDTAGIQQQLDELCPPPPKPIWSRSFPWMQHGLPLLHTDWLESSPPQGQSCSWRERRELVSGLVSELGPLRHASLTLPLADLRASEPGLLCFVPQLPFQSIDTYFVIQFLFQLSGDPGLVVRTCPTCSLRMMLSGAQNTPSAFPQSHDSTPDI